ncbi:MAG: pentapeptide repeat-containing protein [Lachnospirales bacterium]
MLLLLLTYIRAVRYRFLYRNTILISIRAFFITVGFARRTAFLAGTLFIRAFLIRTLLYKRALFLRALLHGTVFIGTIFIGAILVRTVLIGAVFVGAILIRTIFVGTFLARTIRVGTALMRTVAAAGIFFMSRTFLITGAFFLVTFLRQLVKLREI